MEYGNMIILEVIVILCLVLISIEWKKDEIVIYLDMKKILIENLDE